MAGKVAIIGAGLAGTSCAYFLKRAGFTPVIFEAGADIASGASGNPVGLYNPRFFAEKTSVAEFYGQAYLAVSKFFRQAGTEIDHSQHGSMHLITNEDKKIRFRKMEESWNWPDDQMRIVSKAEASEIGGVSLEYDALFLEGSGTVSPKKLCSYYASGCEVRLNKPAEELVFENSFWRLDGEMFDIVIFCCGAAVLKFQQTSWLPVHTVRGQILQFRVVGSLSGLRTNINYGGYVTPAADGIHTCGSTFQKWLDHTELLQKDNEDILKNLELYISAFKSEKQVTEARAALRTVSKDHLPIIGEVPYINKDDGQLDEYIPNFYVSTAHGSHGIITTYMAANIICKAIKREPEYSFSASLKARRFIK